MSKKQNDKKIRIELSDEKMSNTELEAALVSGNFKLSNDGGGMVLSITKNKNYEKDEKPVNPITTSEIEAITRKHGVKLTKRIYRKAEDRPFGGAADSYANRTLKSVNLRLSPEMLKAVDAEVQEIKKDHSKFTRQDWLRDAVLSKLEFNN